MIGGARPQTLRHLRAADRAMARVQDQLLIAIAVEPAEGHRAEIRELRDTLADPGGWLSQYARDEWPEA